MSIIKLEPYRSFELYYDEDDDIFYSELKDRYKLKKEPKRSSLKSLKLEIDKHIKTNLNFKPFTAILKSAYSPEVTGEFIKVIQVKKDGGLIYIKIGDKEERKNHLSASEIIRYKEETNKYIKHYPVLYEASSKNNELRDKILLIEKEIKKLNKDKETLSHQYDPLDISFIDEFKSDPI